MTISVAIFTYCCHGNKYQRCNTHDLKETSFHLSPGEFKKGMIYVKVMLMFCFCRTRSHGRLMCWTCSQQIYTSSRRASTLLPFRHFSWHHKLPNLIEHLISTDTLGRGTICSSAKYSSVL